MPNRSSSVPLGWRGSFPLAVDDLSLIPLSCSGLECTLVAAQDGGWLCYNLAGVGSPLSTRLCRFIPVYGRCFTLRMAHASLTVTG
jgi:hypothetical protein